MTRVEEPADDSARSTKTAIVEDHELFRDVLCTTVDATPDLELVFAVGDAQDALARLEHEPIDLILVDLSMPSVTGSDLVATIRERWPEIRCVVVSGSMAFLFWLGEPSPHQLPVVRDRGDAGGP